MTTPRRAFALPDTADAEGISANGKHGVLEISIPKKPEAAPRVVAPGERFTIGDIEIVAVPVPHGNVTVFAYRLGPLAYVTDAKSLPADALDALRGARVLVINALFRTDHPAHLSIPQAGRVARGGGAVGEDLTHLTHDNFHAVLEAELPAGIMPAFDGLTVDI